MPALIAAFIIRQNKMIEDTHDAFERLRQNPEEAQVFDDAMTDISDIWAPLTAHSYDFGQWDRLTDLGGGNGLLLANILRAHSRLRGVLADQAHVLERAKACDFWDVSQTTFVSSPPIFPGRYRPAAVPI